ncbi:MAG: ATP-binding protein [Jatrophihabitans sp.]|nr:MAG: ATP-binding protein [Jatrophihabitans sp.]
MDEPAVELRAAARAAGVGGQGRQDHPVEGRVTGRLVAVSGLPGVGKTSVAEILAARTGSVHLSIDAVEESILRCGLTSGWQVGVAAYEVSRAMAEQNLRLGHDVVVDAVNDSEAARQTWRTATGRTGAQIDFVHLVISDEREHERRLSDRDRGLALVGEPTWADVQRRRADYAVWSDEVLEFDTSARTAGEIVDTLIALLGQR